MIKAEFIRVVRANPYAFPLPCDNVPSDWWAEAWRIDRVRDELSSDMARTVSKEGELSYSDGYFDLLARALTAEQLLALYLFIRDESRRLESEWRPQFESLFPSCVNLLPTPRPEPPLEEAHEVTDQFTCDDIPY
jgi:hypothetical protein